ncbi:hypothetical protein [Streptomyces brevispora]|uniref:Serine O-acetyltransferase n=1 Tax=Streptomyces brevispora TaxID=887462 RepID=A0A561V5K8_9ACTN|nr:hypothetical protein [Streptomyces brevispora]TWG06919.1 serine O-acetyltransferase [Streptomyces brevispora]WSC12219.1 hypothetical protein OIE64_04755 [Streptomyces brevispora]
MAWIKLIFFLRRLRFVPKRFVYEMLFWYGADIPWTVKFGDNVKIHHRGIGVVIHPRTTIGNRVQIWHGVTLGRADVFRSPHDSDFGGFVVEDDALLCAGAKVLGGSGTTRVGRGTIIAANAVLLESTGDWEVWAGIPARKVADRKDVTRPGRTPRGTFGARTSL